eukprot:gene3007-5017_t
MDTNSQDFQDVLAMGFDKNLVINAFSIHKTKEDAVNWLLLSEQGMTKEDLVELKEANEVIIEVTSNQENPEKRIKQQENSVEDIPTDVWLKEILGYSSIDDMVALSEVNKNFNQIASSDFFWKPIIENQHQNNKFSEYIKDVNLEIFKYFNYQPFNYTKIKNENLLDSDYELGTSNYKTEYSNFRKHQQMSNVTQEGKYRNYDWESYVNRTNLEIGFGVTWLAYLLSLTLAVFILGITVPLNLDSIIPKEGFWFLFNWIPIMLFAIIYVVIFALNSFAGKYIPFFSQNQCLNLDTPLYTVAVSYHFSFLPFFVFSIGIKLIALNNVNCWTYLVGIPTVIFAAITLINLIPFYYRLFIFSEGYVKLTWASTGTLVDIAITFLTMSAGLILITLNLDGFTKIPWSLAFIPFYIPVFVWAIFYPYQLFFGLVLDVSDLREDWLSLMYAGTIGSCVSVALCLCSIMWWATFLLVGLKLDGIIQTWFTICFIPFYSIYFISIAILTTIFCCFGCFYWICLSDDY